MKENLQVLDIASGHIDVIPGSEGGEQPRWSPDGKYISTVSVKTKDLKIYDLKTQTWTALAAKGMNMNYPQFSRDSQSIYFLRLGDAQGVFKVGVHGSAEERVVDLTGWHMQGYFGHYMGLDPNEAPLLMKDVGSQDIYALRFEEK